jgi:hypothetical protein
MLFVMFMLSNVFANVIPLPEHPRPDWERSDWVNLNGEWDFGFEKNTYNKKITVPFGWGSKLSGVKTEEGKDTGYYKKSVTVPANWKGRRVFVVVGAADHDTDCYIDGTPLGKHVGGYTPFEYEITDFIRWGQSQNIEFRVWDPNNRTARQGHYLYGKQGYGNVRGIWQTVYLEARGMNYFESSRFTPNIKKSSVTADLRLGEPAKSMLVAKVILDGKTTEVMFNPGEIEKSVEIKLQNPKLWDLDNPHLYDVSLLLSSVSQSWKADAVKTYFGFREIGTGLNSNGDNYVTLNGKPIYLQICLDQSYHPDGWYTFPSDEFMKNEILLSKKLALSGNRVHIKVEIPRKLYWADKLGLLIQADVPNAWGEPSELMFEEHWKCFKEMVKRDYNHPSIYQWTLFNETWGLKSNRSLSMGLAAGNKGKRPSYRPWTQRCVANAYFNAKKLDPSRIVEDNSPCLNDHVITDVNTWHSYLPGYKWNNCVETFCKNTFVGSKNNYIAGFVQTGAPMMNSECGNVWGYRGSTGDCDFTWDYHMMINAFRRHLKCAGWLYTEHHDVINEWNGYVRFDRSPKYDGMDELAGMSLKDLHSDAVIVFFGKRGSETGEILVPGVKHIIPVGPSLVTEKYDGKKLSLAMSAWWYDEKGAKKTIAEKIVKNEFVAKGWKVEKLWDAVFDAPQTQSSGCVVFRLLADGKEIARNFWSFSTVDKNATMLKPLASNWSDGTSEVLEGLKINGFGKGYFEYELDAPKDGGVFRIELSAKRKNGKDYKDGKVPQGLDYMLGGGGHDRSKNQNSYPQTSVVKYPANLNVYVDGKLVAKQVLPDDPADHRGILSWLSQLRDFRLREAGSYGYLVEVPITANQVKNGKVKIRLESDAGLAVYGPRFGRYPLAPAVTSK